MMDVDSGSDFQSRNQHHESHRDEEVFYTTLTYPLPMEKKLAQGDAFRASAKKLTQELSEIDRFYSSPEAPPHTGPPECTRCKEKKVKVTEAFSQYYLSSDPGTWSLDYPELRIALQKMASDKLVNLNEMHHLFQAGLRTHLKRDLCTTNLEDLSPVESLKKATTTMFDDAVPTSDIMLFYLSQLEAQSPDPEASRFMTALQETKTPEERVSLFVEYYCSASSHDPSILRNFKQKYARMFEALVPHDEVLSGMRKEASEFQKNRVGKFKSQLSELQMAQNAHLKNKQRKLDRNGRERDNLRDQTVGCSLEDCMNEVNLMTDNIIECAICEWLAGKGGQNAERRERAIYCSIDHAESDFENHDHHCHACIMGERCINFPAAGPSSPTSSGLCNNCSSHGFISYFCSADCHNHNYELHRDDFTQRDIGIHNDDDALESFSPARELEIVERLHDRGERDQHPHDEYPDGELEEGERMEDH